MLVGPDRPLTKGEFPEKSERYNNWPLLTLILSILHILYILCLVQEAVENRVCLRAGLGFCYSDEDGNSVSNRAVGARVNRPLDL